MFRIHFTDDYGQGAFDVETRQDAYEARDRLNNDKEHVAWDIWWENLDDPTEDY